MTKNLEDLYKEEYKKLIDDGEGFQNYNALAGFVLKLLGGGEKGKAYILKIEEELLQRNLIKEKIEGRKFFIKNRTADGDFNRMLFYISQVREPLSSI